mgnify:CR=1 FL=1
MKILAKYYEHSMHGHKRMQAQHFHYWNNHRAVLHLRGTVIPYIREYLTDIDGVIRLDKIYIQPKLREHDISIMDIAINIDTLTGPDLQRINAVREWYNIMYVSEISTMDGKELLPGIDNLSLIHI